MWRCVSEAPRHVVWRVLLGACLLFWLCVASLVASCMPSTAHAQDVTFTGTIGADAWHISGGPARYLPDYSTPEPWRSTSAWARGSVQTRLDTEAGPLTLTAQGQKHQVNGSRVDRLDADLRLTDASGVRVGVLPYRISWCRTYDNRSPWLAEPDAFCRFSGLNELATGAFGSQVYHSALLAGWLVDSMAGVYRPSVDGQVQGLGPYTSVGPTVLHTAHGASVNALHLASGIQTRAGWLRTRQTQDDTTGAKGAYQRRLEYDSYYLAAEGNVSPQLEVRASLAGYLGEQVNPANLYGWDGRSATLEAIYKPAPGHSLALGYSRYRNATDYAADTIHRQRLSVPSTSLAWRFDLPAGWWAVLQWTRTDDDYTSRKGVQTVRAGEAVGARIAKSF